MFPVNFIVDVPGVNVRPELERFHCVPLVPERVQVPDPMLSAVVLAELLTAPLSVKSKLLLANVPLFRIIPAELNASCSV